MKDIDTKVLNGIAVRDGDVRFFFRRRTTPISVGYPTGRGFWQGSVNKCWPADAEKGLFSTGCQPPFLWMGR
jgi:hypothetical protein